MPERKSLTLIIPVFNEQESISLFLDRARPALAQALALMGANACADYLFVDDGSTDRTQDVLAILSGLSPDVRFIALSRNFGKEAALAAGISQAHSDAIIPIDVDLQDPPEVIVDMVRMWLGGAQVVNARRIDRSSDGWFKRWSAQSFYRILNRLSDHPIPENVGDFRLLDRQAVDILKQLSERARFNKGLFSWIGFRVATVDYERAPRGAGETKWNTRRLWSLALDGIVSSTTIPLRMWSYVGVAIAAGAFLYALFLVVVALTTGTGAPGYASIMVTMLMLGGLNLLSLGIMGEYLGRVAREVRSRPLYVIAQTSTPHQAVTPVPIEQKGEPLWIDQSMRA